MGAILENLIRAIPWADFWEPVTTRQKCIKWTVILLVLSLGISIFLFKLDDIQAHEYACEHPVIVEGEQKVVEEHYGLTGGSYFEIFVSYSYDGVDYEDVYYRSSKNPSTRWDGGKSITIAVAPNDPGMPIRLMFNEDPVILAAVLWSLGFAALIYGIALEFPRFRNWRVSCANRPAFLSRPYGKPVKYTANPDYPKDFVFFFVPIAFISAIILGFLFPYSFSP